VLSLATPRKSTFRLTSSKGEVLPVEVTSGAGARPAVVLWPSGDFPPGLVDRLARAGFAVVTLATGHSAGDLGLILKALTTGRLGPPPLSIGIAFVGGEPTPEVAGVADGAQLPARTVSAPEDFDAMVSWFGERLT
jgi:hypothetical protein